MKALVYRVMVFVASVIAMNISLYGQMVFSDVSQQLPANYDGQNYGVAIGDYDNDGLEDIFISRYDNHNILLKNLGNFDFADVTEASGLMHVANTLMSIWVDIDNDGFLDLYTGNFMSNDVLYKNNGDGTFSDITISAGIENPHQVRAVLAADFNRDGYLDLYIANLSASNILYMNNGDGTFSNRTQHAGVDFQGVSQGSVVLDYNNDGWPDIYLAHDAMQPNILFRNNGNGTFTNVASEAGVNYRGFGMAADAGDINNDGLLDIYVTNLYENVLYINNGDGTFRDVADSCGAQDLGMAWSVTISDMNNSGHKDIYISNDTEFPTPSRPNILFENTGEMLFAESEDEVVSSPYASYAHAVVDFDGDGDLDLVITNTGQHGIQLLRNDSPSGHFIAFDLEGSVSNRQAIGAKVFLYHGGNMISMDEKHAGHGFASQHTQWVHFGVGEIQMLDSIVIQWPSGQNETHTQLLTNKRYHIVENSSFTTSVGSISLAGIPVHLVNTYARGHLLVHSEMPVKDVDVYIYNMYGSAIIKNRMDFTPGMNYLPLPENTGMFVLLLSMGEMTYTKRFFHPGN